jgi:hypothetical protein
MVESRSISGSRRNLLNRRATGCCNYNHGDPIAPDLLNWLAKGYFSVRSPHQFSSPFGAGNWTISLLHSTIRDYTGGEILLQAATPWIILIAHRVPHENTIRSAAFAATAIFLAFLAKLTGLIVIGAALAASGMVELAHSRKITRGMVGGVFGALLAFAVIYVSFLAKGSTPASSTNWSLPLDGIAFAILVPWVAGISWTDLMAWFFSIPQIRFSIVLR